MGLTIHYELSLPGLTPQHVVEEMLERLRQRIMDLPFKQVDDKLTTREGDAADFSQSKKDDDKRWFLIQCQAHANFKYDRQGRPTRAGWRISRFSMSFPPAKVIGFSAWPGEGCEEANFGMCRFPERVEVKGEDGLPHSVSLGKPGWSWRSFCKTQYANDPRLGGFGNFLRCHLGMIAALDAAKELGFQVKVNDEGGFWKSRKVDKLAKALGEYDALVAGIGLQLGDLGFNKEVRSALDGRPDRERLELKGQELLEKVKAKGLPKADQ